MLSAGTLTAPPGFAPTSFPPTETLVSTAWRGPAEQALADPRALKGTQALPPPSLWVHRRAGHTDVTANAVVDAEVAQVLKSLPSTSRHGTTPFRFADGTAGALARVELKLGDAHSIQTLVARVDGDVATVMVFAVSALGQTRWQTAMATAMASFRP